MLTSAGWLRQAQPPAYELAILNLESKSKLISENSHLFWWVPEDKKKDISFESLVEAILNYGNEQSVKRLFELYGIKRVAEVFYSQIKRERSNYLPQVKHYFSLYFRKYA